MSHLSRWIEFTSSIWKTLLLSSSTNLPRICQSLHRS